MSSYGATTTTSHVPIQRLIGQLLGELIGLNFQLHLNVAHAYLQGLEALPRTRTGRRRGRAVTGQPLNWLTNTKPCPLSIEGLVVEFLGELLDLLDLDLLFGHDASI